MTGQRSAAIFDFDETLLAAESAREFVHYLKDRRQMSWDGKWIPLDFVLRAWVTSQLHRWHLISEAQLAQSLLRFYRGRHIGSFQAFAPGFYRDVLRPHLAPSMLARVRAHRAAGHRLVLISASPRYVLAPAVADLGFDDLRCTELEVRPDGRCTGRSVGPVCVGDAKLEQALALAREQDLDLAASWAYGNHETDAPLLAGVGHSVAVSPTRRLARIARERGWPIVGYPEADAGGAGPVL